MTIVHAQQLVCYLFTTSQNISRQSVLLRMVEVEDPEEQMEFFLDLRLWEAIQQSTSIIGKRIRRIDAVREYWLRQSQRMGGSRLYLLF